MNNETHTKSKYSKSIFCLEMLLYIGRWQLSTFTMTPVIILAKWIGIINSWEQVALANLISAPLFYFVDKFILVYICKLIIRLTKQEIEK